MLRILTLSFLSLLSMTSLGQGFSDSIAAKVNGKIITSFDVDRLAARSITAIRKSVSGAEAQRQISAVRNDALNYLINKELVISEFRRKGFPVPPKAVDTRIERIIREDYNESLERFYAHVESTGQSLSEYRGNLEDSIIYEMMLGEFVNRKASATPEEIKGFYEANLEMFALDRRIEARVIYIKDSEGVLEKFKAALAGGDDFASLAMKYSVLPNATKGGDLGGLVPEKDILPIFVKELNKLNEGEVSSPVAFDKGTIFLKLEKRVDAGHRPLSDVYSSIERKLIAEKEQVLTRKFIADLKKKSNVEILGMK